MSRTPVGWLTAATLLALASTPFAARTVNWAQAQPKSDVLRKATPKLDTREKSASPAWVVDGYRRLNGEAEQAYKLIDIKAGGTNRDEILELRLSTVALGEKWMLPGCGMKMAAHPYLTQAFQPGFILVIKSEVGGCLGWYRLTREPDAPPAPTPAPSAGRTGPPFSATASTISFTGTGARLTPPPAGPRSATAPELSFQGTEASITPPPAPPRSVTAPEISFVGTGTF